MFVGILTLAKLLLMSDFGLIRSYPSGRYDEQVVEILKSTSYWGAVTINQGAQQSSDRTFELQRIRVWGSYSLGDFAYWLNYWLENSE